MKLIPCDDTEDTLDKILDYASAEYGIEPPMTLMVIDSGGRRTTAKLWNDREPELLDDELEDRNVGPWTVYVTADHRHIAMFTIEEGYLQ